MSLAAARVAAGRRLSASFVDAEGVVDVFSNE